MIAAQEKGTGPRDGPPLRPSKESLRNGESEYGRQFSGGSQGNSVYVNSNLGGQLFLGSEIALLEPISSRSITIDEQAVESALTRQEIDNEKITEQISEFKGIEKNKKVSSPQLQNQIDHSAVKEQIQMRSVEFLPSHKIEEEFFSRISFSDTNEFPRNMLKANDYTPPDQVLLIPPIPSGSAQLIKPPPFVAPVSTENQRFFTSETIAASSVKYLPFGHSRSNSFVVIKSADKDLGDTLVSDSLSRLDARYFSQVEFIVYNGKNNATLIGNALDNTLIGGGGNDNLIGAGGDDQLIGGSGNDVFVFGVNDGHDQIIDFSFGDKIQFRGAASLDQLELSNSDTGQLIQFEETIVEIVGVGGLTMSADWIVLSG